MVERVRQRGDLERHKPEGISAWLDLVHSHQGDWTQTIDTSALTPEETLEQIYNHIKETEGIQTTLLPE